MTRDMPPVVPLAVAMLHFELLPGPAVLCENVYKLFLFTFHSSLLLSDLAEFQDDLLQDFDFLAPGNLANCEKWLMVECSSCSLTLGFCWWGQPNASKAFAVSRLQHCSNPRCEDVKHTYIQNNKFMLWMQYYISASKKTYDKIRECDLCPPFCDGGRCGSCFAKKEVAMPPAPRIQVFIYSIVGVGVWHV